MKRDYMRLSTGTLMLMIMLAGTLSFAAPPVKETETPGQFRVQMQHIAGYLRQNGNSGGLTKMVYKPTHTPLDHSPGIFNYYRIFTTNKRYADLRGRPSQARQLSDNTIEVTWPQNEKHPFTVVATYTVTAPNIVDLETRVTAHTDLPDFEVFLSSYTNDHFPLTQVYTVNEATGQPQFLKADADHGTWQTFPRDAEAVPMIKDGRWDIAPNAVDWEVREPLAAPLAYRKDPESGATQIFMAPKEEAFAMFSPKEGEGHYSVYFSLFGKTLKESETVCAHARYLVAQDIKEEDIVALYKQYIASLKLKESDQ